MNHVPKYRLFNSGFNRNYVATDFKSQNGALWEKTTKTTRNRFLSGYVEVDAEALKTAIEGAVEGMVRIEFSAWPTRPPLPKRY